MSWIDIPADAAASVDDSVKRSSTPLSHSSPKRVQPIPMMATWSRMPLLPIVPTLLASSAPPAPVSAPASGQGLPGSSTRPGPSTAPSPERHRDPVADGQLVGPGIGQLAAEAATPVEVDDHPDHRRRQRESQVVDGEGGDRARHVGQPLELHLVDGVAVEAGPGRGHVAEAAGRAAARRKGVLPFLGAVHRRRARPLGVGTAGRLAVQLRAPGQERGVGEVVAPRCDLLGHGGHARLRARPLRPGQRRRRPEHERVGAVGQGQDGDHLARLRTLQHVAERHGRVSRAEIPDRGQQVGR